MIRLWDGRQCGVRLTRIEALQVKDALERAVLPESIDAAVPRPPST